MLLLKNTKFILQNQNNLQTSQSVMLDVLTVTAGNRPAGLEPVQLSNHLNDNNRLSGLEEQLCVRR